MKKIKLMIEMDEEIYNLTRLHIRYWLSNPRNRRTTYPYGLYSEFYEDKRIEKCDDCVSRQAVLNKAFEVKTGENTSAMVVYAEDIRKELPVKPKLAFNERITTVPMPFE